MRFGQIGILVSGALLGSLAALPAHAQSTGLDDLVGARAGQAENALQTRGYRFVRGEKGDDRSYAYWWNADRRQCVTIATMNGRYDSITPTTAPDCRQRANLRPRPDYAQPPTRPRPGYEPDPGFGRPPPRPSDRPDYADGGAVVDGRPVELGLVCFGDGKKDALASGSTWTWNSRRDRYEHGTYTETRPEVFDATLMVQLWRDGGRIRLPKSLIPPINSRGASGWWDLYDVRLGNDVVTASYRLNGLNKPKVTIDRRSGRISVRGFSEYAFSGSCDLLGAGGRKF